MLLVEFLSAILLINVLWITVPQPGVVAAAATIDSSPNRPSFLVITVDDLRTELGYATSTGVHYTPRIDALASQSVVFDRAYVQQGVCGPSRYLLRGQNFVN